MTKERMTREKAYELRGMALDAIIQMAVDTEEGMKAFVEFYQAAKPYMEEDE